MRSLLELCAIPEANFSLSAGTGVTLVPLESVMSAARDLCNSSDPLAVRRLGRLPVSAGRFPEGARSDEARRRES